MKTTVKTITHIQQQRNLHKQSRKYIQQRLKLSDYEYQNELFERGCRFLEDEYAHGKFQKYYKQFSRDKNYWKWFIAEWKQFEGDYVADIEIAHLKFNCQEWNKELDIFLNSHVLRDSFYSIYLKRLANGNL